MFPEAERIIIANTRPLTLNSPCPGESEPLTPSHFLNLHPSTNIRPDVVSKNDKFSRKRWRQAQLLANHYWRRWLKEYMPTLQERPKWQQEKRNLHVGDIVLVVDDNVARNQWALGRVENVFPGADGLVTTVEVREKGATL